MAVTSAKAARSVFACSECGHESPKWLGRCPGCESWNSYVEAISSKQLVASKGARASAGAAPVELASMADEDEPRMPTGIAEFDRVLGGGIVSGSLVLVGGDPGIGKSTLLLQVAAPSPTAGRSSTYPARRARGS